MKSIGKILSNEIEWSVTNIDRHLTLSISQFNSLHILIIKNKIEKIRLKNKVRFQ
jgi:hypothetical protein